MHMLIRHATMEDLDAIEAVEAACFPPAEAATNESLTARVATYPEHFWLLINTDADDAARFPASVIWLKACMRMFPCTTNMAIGR